ncbi:MAG: class I SAM-dependent methyltransferase [Deltaproteobacteria bacterium]|nr:class I SAM-dependent methyltransferase [Deltaproteobacteria bacterium]
MPDEEHLAALYGREYFERPSGDVEETGVAGYHDYVGLRFMRQWDYRRVALNLIDMVATSPPPPPAARLLDVGCAMGYFMDVADDVGFDVEGIDRNPDAIRRLSFKYRFPVTCADFASFNGGPYEAVTMLDMLEHFSDPFGALAKTASLTRSGGVLAISTPDSGSLVARLLGRRNELIQKASSGEHLTFFTRQTLTAALDRAGFDVVRIDSYGVTLDLATASRRIGAALPLVGAMVGAAVGAFGLSRAFVHFNHHLNMIAYASKR